MAWIIFGCNCFYRKCFFGADATVFIYAILGWAVLVLGNFAGELKESNISHNSVDIDYNNGVWIIQMDNHVAHMERKGVQELYKFLKKTISEEGIEF